MLLLVISMLLPIGGCASGGKRQSIASFAAVQPLDRGRVYLRASASHPEAAGTLLSVNGGPWTTEAVAARGDRVEVDPANPNAAATAAYRMLGPTRGGHVRVEEQRWFRDGFPAEHRILRVRPYGDIVGPAERAPGSSPHPASPVAAGR